MVQPQQSRNLRNRTARVLQAVLLQSMQQGQGSSSRVGFGRKVVMVQQHMLPSSCGSHLAAGQRFRASTLQVSLCPLAIGVGCMTPA